MGSDNCGAFGVNSNIGDMVDLVVDLGTNMSDNRGSDNMVSDLVDRGMNNSWGSMVGISRGSIGNGGSRGNSSVGNSNRGMDGTSKSSITTSKSSITTKTSISTKTSSITAKTSITSKTSISTKTSKASTVGSTIEKLSISLTSRGSNSHSHESRQSNKGIHVDQC